MNPKSDARPSATEVAAALDPVVHRALADGPVDSFDDITVPRDRLVAVHLDVLAAFTATLGGTTKTRASEGSPNVKVDVQMLGFSDIDTSGQRDRDAGRLRFEVGRDTRALDGPNADLDDNRFIAHIWYLWLPPELQHHGYGRQLVLALIRLWTAMGVELAAATAVRETSRAAFPKWGFKSVGCDGNGEPMFTRALN